MKVSINNHLINISEKITKYLYLYIINYYIISVIHIGCLNLFLELLHEQTGEKWQC